MKKTHWKRGLLVAVGMILSILSLTACPDLNLKAVLLADPRRGEAPLPVVFDISKSAESVSGFLLDFGDGTTHLGNDPSIPIYHTYEEPGTYTATLTVWTPNGREATDSITIEVLPPLLRAVLNASPQYGYAPLEVTFDVSESVGRISEFTLDFGDGESVDKGAAEIAEPISHIYVNPGTYTATLRVRGLGGNEDTQSLVIYVEYPPLEASLIAEPTEGESPLSVTFDLSGSVGEITRFILDFGDGEVITGSDVRGYITHIYSRAGTYHASLTVVDPYGQSDTASVTIEVR